MQQCISIMNELLSQTILRGASVLAASCCAN